MEFKRAREAQVGVDKTGSSPMITGIRGRVFISYRWSGSDFKSVVASIANGLVRRGYEAIFDAWYVDETTREPALHMMQELAASTGFVAAISPDYVSVLKGLVLKNEFGELHSHDVANDGWVRDELNHVLMCQCSFWGLGICFACNPGCDPDFPFPTLEVSDTVQIDAILDAQFGPELDLPLRVRPEIKHQGKWIVLPEMPLYIAYRLVRQTLAELCSRPAEYFLPPTRFSMWSRLDRRHLIWESREVAIADGTDSLVGTVLACPSCTAQYQSNAESMQCPRCLRGMLERRRAAKIEALVVMRPVDAAAS